MNANYLIYQAERPRTTAGQRDQDQRAGELAATIAELWQSVKKPVRWAKHATVHYPQGVTAARSQEWCGQGQQWSHSRA